MASSAQASPRQRISSADLDAFDDFGSGPSMPSLGGGVGNRARLPSSEIPRTYSGLYGAGVSGHESHLSNDYSNDGDAAGSSSGNNMPHHQPRTNSNNSTYKAGSNLLPFELSRNRNTDWIAEGGPSLLLFYLLFILVVLLTFLAFVTEPKLAWTLTSIVHAVSTMVYLHWIKGNPADYMDGTQGEMNAMTCWEQIVSKPAKHHLDTRARTYTDESVDSWHSYSASPLMSVRQRMTVAIKKLRSRDVLCIIPTLLAHASCHVAKYQQEYVLVNVGVWAVVMLPKMPFMNGVRLFGINRTIGIDDGDYQAEDYDTPDETEEEDDNNIATTPRTNADDDCDLGLDIIDATEEDETKKTR